jgi:6-pyruvoyltetrahydropterin/6-carboxytetrahydropterin synthase
MTQNITRKGSFDAGHRVMNERMKCFNIHGHTYLYEITFSFTQMADIGYALDFKEIKRVFCQWIEDYLDHGMILNPHDTKLIEVTKDYGSKLWLMSLNGKDRYCNPTVENLAKEVFLAMKIIAETLYANSKFIIFPSNVRIYETPNCYTDCDASSILKLELENFIETRANLISQYAIEKGVVEYDDRLIK